MPYLIFCFTWGAFVSTAASLNVNRQAADLFARALARFGPSPAAEVQTAAAPDGVEAARDLVQDQERERLPRALALLHGDDRLRTIAKYKLEGYRNEDIADELAELLLGLPRVRGRHDDDVSVRLDARHESALQLDVSIGL